MNQPLSRLAKQIVLSHIVLLTLSGCGLVSTIKTTRTTPTPTQISTPENCSWNWAYGDGSTEFESTVTQKLAGEGILATIDSSSYGEINSCDQIFSPMVFDIKIEIKVDNLVDQDLLIALSDQVFTDLQDNLPISNINNLGNVSLTFITPDSITCNWNSSLKQCAE